MHIQTILCSVADKRGLASFAKRLSKELSWIASSGTAQALRSASLKPRAVEELTSFPECFGGRVKTLHPRLLGGILLRRGVDEKEAEGLQIPPIDMVVCNLYDFSGAAKEERPLDSLIELIDIGGSALIRAAAKNYERVAVVVDPDDYPVIAEELESSRGFLSLETRERLALKGFRLSAEYDRLIAAELSRRFGRGDEEERLSLCKKRRLRYGENPDQEGWIFEQKGSLGLAQAEILSGKELSYNNYEDASSAFRAVRELEELACQGAFAVVKHGCLCGYAAAGSLEEAFRLAWQSDEKSAFGSVAAASQEVGEGLIAELEGKFIEALAAPGFSDSFVSWCRQKRPSLRLIRMPPVSKNGLLYKSIQGALLAQSEKKSLLPPPSELFSERAEGSPCGVVTKKQPPKALWNLYRFAALSVNFSKSNACALARELGQGRYQLVGMGAGQPNRIDCLERLAIPKARELLDGEPAELVAASDGFFPFRDSLDALAEAGIGHCIQPGGSKRDPELIEAADQLGICMVFTGNRYFSH